MADFQDHFSKQAGIYVKARPHYPDELFSYLASVAPGTQLCWDCATGNGQAAVSLAKHFDKVIATDGSRQQIDNAITAPNVEYRVGIAEESDLADHSIDLITVATAAHWFNHDKFYAEAQRVAKPNGILAVWAYSEAIISPEIDALMEWFMYDYLRDYWPPGRWYIRNSYTNLPFPFAMLKAPALVCNLQWTRQHWLNYIKSWSAYNNYVTQHATDPLDKLIPELNNLWNDTELKQIVWPLHLKCARLNSK